MYLLNLVNSITMADFTITQNIPVSNHVYKYLKNRYGDDHIIATRETVVGGIVLSLLNRNNDIRHVSKKSYDKVFSVLIKEEKYLRNGVHIDTRSAQAFNDTIDKMFREELFCHVMINKFSNNEQFNKGIRNFLKVYDITEDDIKYETLYRDFKRKKDNIQISLNLEKQP